MPADSETLLLGAEFFTLGATAAAVGYLTNTLEVDVELEQLDFVSNAALTANDTNYRTLTASKGGTAIVTPKTTQTAPTGTGDLAAAQVVNLVLLQAQKKNRRLAPGESILVSATHTASGVAISGKFQGRFRRVR